MVLRIDDTLRHRVDHLLRREFRAAALNQLLLHVRLDRRRLAFGVEQRVLHVRSINGLRNWGEPCHTILKAPIRAGASRCNVLVVYLLRRPPSG